MDSDVSDGLYIMENNLVEFDWLENIEIVLDFSNLNYFQCQSWYISLGLFSKPNVFTIQNVWAERKKISSNQP